MNLTSLLLRWVARSSDSLVAFVVGLDAKLDVFLLKHDADVAGFEQEVRDITAVAEAAVEAIREEAGEQVSKVERKIDDATRAASILKGLKDALPTGK